jgi:SPP1 family predicted phage head-tail adaptor
MRAGDLRHRVTFQSRSMAADSFGGQSPVWTDVATVSADISPLSGRELVAAQSVNVEISHMVTIRYQQQFAGPKAVAAMRIVYGDRIFNIHASIDPDERHKSIQLTCSEGLNLG